jgi:hypothetical protein
MSNLTLKDVQTFNSVEELADFLENSALKIETVIKVEPALKEDLWDLSVTDETIDLPHSYFVEGILTHNSTEPLYVQNILKTMGVDAAVEDVFGIKDKKGVYIKKPRVRYVSSSTAETFFDYVASLERELPDKIYEGDNWWYVYENTKDNRKKLDESGHEYDKTLFSKYNKFYVKAEDGGLQALIIVDSYPAMLPERLAEEDANSGLGAVARMFAEQIPRVKGKMKKKRIAIVGVNQLRDRPMVRFGNPEYEPSGNAVRFYSDVRIKHMARAVSSVSDATQAAEGGGIEVEKSVEFEGNSDTYRYISISGDKNKKSTPFLKAFLRLWVNDGDNQARGFDPVFDTYEYLKATNQVSSGGRRSKIMFKLDKVVSKKPIDWQDFKTLILGDSDSIKAVCKKAGLEKPVRIRKYCFKQMADGTGLDLYGAARQNAPKDKSE